MKSALEIRQELIKCGVSQFMNNISKALNAENNEQATKEFINFGWFLQDQYPGIGLDDLRKQVKRLIQEEFYDDEMPNLNFIHYFTEGRLTLYQDLATEDDFDINQVYRMDAAIKGLNIFSHMLGDDRWANSLKAHELDPNVLQQTQNWILEAPYQVSKNLSEAARARGLAENFVTEIRNNIEGTQKELIKQIREEIKDNPILKPYQDLEINDLVKSLVENEEPDEYLIKIKMAAASYDALQQLTEIIDEAGTPQERLGRFKEGLETESIKNALETNPDDKVTQFLKKVGYILKCALTLSAYHWFNEGKSLRSPQQQSLKEAVQTLKRADEDGVIESPQYLM